MSDQPSQQEQMDNRRPPGDGSETPVDPTSAAIGQLNIQSPSAQSISSSSTDDSSTLTAGAWRPNADLLSSIMALGFNKNLAEKALFYASNDSLELAVNWIIDYGDRFDDGQPLDLSRTAPGGVASAGQVMIPYKMVFVVNNTLKMGVGKISAQVGHATLGLYRSMLGNPDQEAALLQWNEQGETKVVLRSDIGEEELLQLREQASRNLLQTYLVADAGRTQIASGSITVLSLFGQSDRVDEITGKLKLLQ